MRIKASSDRPQDHQVNKTRKGETLQEARLAEATSNTRSIDRLDPAHPLTPFKFLNKAKLEGLVFPKTNTLVDNNVKKSGKIIEPFELNKLFEGALRWSPETIKRAGKALQKHGDRRGSFWPQAKGSIEEKERQAVSLVDKIKSSRHTFKVYQKRGRSKGIILDLVNLSGRGVRYTESGLFTFIEATRSDRDDLLEAVRPRRKT